MLSEGPISPPPPMPQADRGEIARLLPSACDARGGRVVFLEAGDTRDGGLTSMA